MPLRRIVGSFDATLREHVEGGGVLAIPTESSYGIAVDPRSSEGVERVYELKRRERGKPLPIVVADVPQAVALGVAPDDPLLRAAEEVWPAALTVVVEHTSGLPAAAGGTTLAVRVPEHEPLLELLRWLGHGLTATSANASGEPPILSPEGLDELFGSRDGILVSVATLPGGPPSTMVTCDGSKGRVLRAGRFPAERLRLPFAD